MFRFNQLFFAPPSSFNDPFDCRLKFDFHGTDSQWDEKLKNLIDIKAPQLSRKQKREHLKRMKKEVGHIDFSNQVLKSLKDEIGVLCLSEKNDEILMWSHYSMGHSGFCLQFDYSKNEAFFGQALKISYADKYRRDF